MTRPPISATIITLNEEKNLTRAIKSLDWVDEIVVIDSGSTDQTCQLARSMGAKVLNNPWPGYGKQKNFAQANTKHEWVLNVDADEEIPEELAQEIRHIVSQTNPPHWGYAIPRKTFYLGRWIKHGGWYPNFVARLSHKKYARWSEPHVHESLQIQGSMGYLKNPMNHFTFSGIEDQVLTNLRYAAFGAYDLKSREKNPRLLKLIFKPLGKFIETYCLKKGFLDGLPGFMISVNAAYSMFLKYAYLFEERIYTIERVDH